jgi:hypothetical protein
LGKMVEHLDSTNLMPFMRRRHSTYHLPDLAMEADEQIIDAVDPQLRPEEQSFVRHYLNYADILLKNTRESEESPRKPKGPSDDDKVTEISKSDGTGSSNGAGSKNRAA